MYMYVTSLIFPCVQHSQQYLTEQKAQCEQQLQQLQKVRHCRIHVYKDGHPGILLIL